MFRLLHAELDDIAYLFRCLVEGVRKSRGLDRWLIIVGMMCNPVFWAVSILGKWVFAAIFTWRDYCMPPPKFDEIRCEVRDSWRVRKVTISEAERENSAYPEQPRIDGIPFGYANRYWRYLVKWMKPDDQLWYYDSRHAENIASGEEGSPEWGYVVVRDGRAVARLQTSPDW